MNFDDPRGRLCVDRISRIADTSVRNRLDRGPIKQTETSVLRFIAVTVVESNLIGARPFYCNTP